MDINIPEAPAGVMTLLGFVTPYVVAIVNGLVHATGIAKRTLSVVVALVLAGAALAFYYWITGEPIPDLPLLLLLAVVVAQASYSLVTKGSAKAVENRVAVAAVTRSGSRDPHMEHHSIIPSENDDWPGQEQAGGVLIDADEDDDDEEADFDPGAPDGDEGEPDEPRHAAG